jgi:WD40 repeat protein
MGCHRSATTASARTPAARQQPEKLADQKGPIQPRRVSFDPRDSGRLLVMQANGVTSVWQVADATKPIKTLEIATPAADVDFAADGESIFTAGNEGFVRRWKGDGTEIWRTEISPGKALRTISVSPDGTVIAAGGDDGKVHLASVQGVEIGSVDTGHEMVLALVFSPKGDRLACDGSDTRVRIFRRSEAAPGIELETTFREPDKRYMKMLPNLIRLDVQWGWQESIAFSPDGRQMLIANLDGTCGFWTVDGKRLHRPFTNHGIHHIHAVAFSPLGNLVASGGFDGTAQLWTDNGTLVGRPLAAHNDVITSIAFSPDGKTIATAGMDNSVRLWNAAGARLGTLPRNSTPLLPRSKSK